MQPGAAPAERLHFEQQTMTVGLRMVEQGGRTAVAPVRQDCGVSAEGRAGRMKGDGVLTKLQHLCSYMPVPNYLVNYEMATVELLGALGELVTVEKYIPHIND